MKKSRGRSWSSEVIVRRFALFQLFGAVSERSSLFESLRLSQALGRGKLNDSELLSSPTVAAFSTCIFPSVMFFVFSLFRISFCCCRLISRGRSFASETLESSLVSELFAQKASSLIVHREKLIWKTKAANSRTRTVGQALFRRRRKSSIANETKKWCPLPQLLPCKSQHKHKSLSLCFASLLFRIVGNTR